MEFNSEQLEIINRRQGAYLVAAPVGTGKTSVLVERVALSLSEDKLSASEILCLTFTNRAAEEMRARLKIRLSDPNIFADIAVYTFHGFCAWFLRQEAKSLGLSSDFVIIDETEQSEILSRLTVNLPGADLWKRRDLMNLSENFYQYRLAQLLFELGIRTSEPAAPQEPWLSLMNNYLKTLTDQNSLDFNDLVLMTLRALYKDEVLLDKWSRLFKLIELDEFQDTHLSEYLVIKQLARFHKNIALVGDFSQTIYGWRGSKPVDIADYFKSHFAPVIELSLSQNYRSEPEILQAAKAVLSGEKFKPSGKVKIDERSDITDESLKLVEQIKQIRLTEPDAKIAVLLRTNGYINRLAEVFEKNNISHLTVDQYNFFRRQEIRDALAWLKIIYNKHDQEAMRRVILRPGGQIAPAALNTVNTAGRQMGLGLADLLDFSNYKRQEPFEELLTAWKTGRVVVLDTETTGIDTRRDDVVQVFAQEIVNGAPGKQYHQFIRPSKPVGSSFYVHRLDDEFLKKNGRPPIEVYKELIDFVGDSLIVGHNVSFDLNILMSQASRLGLLWKQEKTADTLDLSRRFLKSSSYRLSVLAKQFNLAKATHSADDDVAATVGLASLLVEKLSEDMAGRRKLFASLNRDFIALATRLARWKLLIQSERPVTALNRILEESGLLEYYSQERNAERRLKSIDTLRELFASQDDLRLEPFESLSRLINYGSLVKNIDFLGLDQGRVPIVTIHQVKGLEFDYVFMPLVNEGIFPSFIKDNDFEEEKRVFYVGLTRAKKGVFLSYSLVDDYGRPQSKSRLLGNLS